MAVEDKSDGMDDAPYFGRLLRRMRNDNEWSLRDLSRESRSTAPTSAESNRVTSSRTANSPNWRIALSMPQACSSQHGSTTSSNGTRSYTLADW